MMQTGGSMFKYNKNKVQTRVTGAGGCTSSLATKKANPPAKKPKAGIFAAQKVVPTTDFKFFYDRGDLPIVIDFTGAIRKVMWKVEDLQVLDYYHYLPIFFHGIREPHDPYKFLADKGLDDLLSAGGAKILPVLPQLIIPIKFALATKQHEIICKTLKKLQRLVLSAEGVAESLVPYYRQILPVFNLSKARNLNIGDKIDYSQKNNENIGDLIQETLEIFEKYGGEDAYINIKYMIPTYESCMF